MPPWSPSGSSVLRGEPLARGLILLTHALGSDGCLRILLLEASMVHRERTKSYILKMGFPNLLNHLLFQSEHTASSRMGEA